MGNVLETDVVVVGAGPVGLTLANLLADRGVRVLLVERNETVSDEPRAISITDESLRVMNQIGIMDELGPEMLMDTGARYFGRKGQLLAEVRARLPRFGQPVKSQFDQPVLAGLLIMAARSRPLVALRFCTEARGIVNGVDSVELDLSAGDSVERVRAKWVVACDGGRSSVRSELGIALEGSTQEEKWIVVDVVNSTHAPEPYSQFHCNGERPCVVVPGVKGRCRFEFMLLPSDDPSTITSPEAIVRLVATYQKITAADIRRAAVYVAQQRIAATYRRGRVLLAGDAAHLMPPFAGQGLNAGVRDAANLAWKIAASVHGDASDDLLDTYETERRPHAADMVRLSYRIGKVVMSTNPVLTALRDHALSALGLIPPAKAWIVGMKFLKQPHLTDGCVVHPRALVPKQVTDLAGRSLAQPRVECVDRKVVPFDDILGPDWAIVHFVEGAEMVVHQASRGSSKGIVHRVVDRDGLFRDVRGSGAAILVRPDRYVAGAAADLGELAQVLGGLRRHLPMLAGRFDLSSVPVSAGSMAGAATG